MIDGLRREKMDRKKFAQFDTFDGGPVRVCVLVNN